MVSDRDTVPDFTPQDPREEIIEYLRAHPAAADTVDGILEWWLCSQRYKTTKDAIQKALDDLVHEGLIDFRDTGEEKRIFFSANRSRKDPQ
ncbi:MAG: hypothetical protein H0X43_07500 [Nitrosospira sp.]|nr:hypothetical protein [Nitrosospira sp.]